MPEACRLALLKEVHHSLLSGSDVQGDNIAMVLNIHTFDSQMILQSITYLRGKGGGTGGRAKGAIAPPILAVEGLSPPPILR